MRLGVERKAKQYFLPRKSSVANHEQSTKHKTKTPSTSQTLLKVTASTREMSDKVKAAELQIAASMACHCAISTIDHLSEIMLHMVRVVHWEI
jgi:hypothetical protein